MLHSLSTPQTETSILHNSVSSSRVIRGPQHGQAFSRDARKTFKKGKACLKPINSIQENGAHVKAATLEQHTLSPQKQENSSSTRETGSFNWTKQWYPIAAVRDLDPTRPHAEMLLGKKLAVWRDKQENWRCFEDECPHRRVPLSEGRISSDGTLMCGYHGWTFEGDGTLADIPQLRSEGTSVNQRAKTNPNSCAKSRPTQVRQGLLFVWGESGPNAEVESQRQLLPVSDFADQHGNEEGMNKTFDQYVRDLPGGFEVWTENMQDQSHVAYAHHTVAGKRGGEKEGFFKMTEVERRVKDPAEQGSAYRLKFDWTANGNSVSTTELFFKPPCMCCFLSAGMRGSLYIYAVPISTSVTRLIINNVYKNPKQPKPHIRFLKKYFPDYIRMMSHLVLNKVNQGDIIYMTGQHRATGRTATDGAKHNYFLTSDADRGTSTWVSWLKTEGGGGPKFSDPAYTANVFWDANGKLNRKEVLDNLSQHTSKCSSCSKVLKDVKKAQKFATVFLGIAYLAISACFGRGLVPWSIPVLVTIAASALVAYSMTKLEAFKKRLTFENWSQADLK